MWVVKTHILFCDFHFEYQSYYLKVFCLGRLLFSSLSVQKEEASLETFPSSIYWHFWGAVLLRTLSGVCKGNGNKCASFLVPEFSTYVSFFSPVFRGFWYLFSDWSLGFLIIHEEPANEDISILPETVWKNGALSTEGYVLMLGFEELSLMLSFQF